MTIPKMLDNYMQWLRTQIYIQEPVGLEQLMYDDNVRIVCVPFLNRHNDGFEVVIIPHDDGNITLSDGGHVRFDMMDSSALVDTDVVNSICCSLGVTNGECLEKQCMADGFPMAFSMFCTCLVKVSAALEVLEYMEGAE